MGKTPSKAYGEGREQTNVSYGDIERAAIAILKSERRPTVETVREALGRGSNGTIGAGLRRFWRDLGARIEGDPAALSRMPSEIAELADGLWQRALKLAGEAATNDENAARERLAQIQIENELKAQSFQLREAEWDTAARERERALADSRDHLRLTLRALNGEQAINQAHERRIADLERNIAQYRQQIGILIAEVIAEKRPERQRRSARAAKLTTRVRKSSRSKKSARRSAAATPRHSRRLPRVSSRRKPGRKRRG